MRDAEVQREVETAGAIRRGHNAVNRQCESTGIREFGVFGVVIVTGAAVTR